MNILFLDDDEIRHEMFWRWTHQTERHDYYTTKVHSYKQFTEIAPTKNWDIIFLDHDLGVEDQMCIPHVTNRFPTGSDVARYMIENDIKAKKIIIHSYNSVGAANMINIFKEVGVTAIYHPFDAGLKEYLPS